MRCLKRSFYKAAVAGLTSLVALCTAFSAQASNDTKPRGSLHPPYKQNAVIGDILPGKGELAHLMATIEERIRDNGMKNSFHIYMDSNGGLVTEGLALMETINRLHDEGYPIRLFVHGSKGAKSIAAIMVAMFKGPKAMLPRPVFGNPSLMFHSPRTEYRQGEKVTGTCYIHGAGCKSEEDQHRLQEIEKDFVRIIAENSVVLNDEKLAARLFELGDYPVNAQTACEWNIVSHTTELSSGGFPVFTGKCKPADLTEARIFARAALFPPNPKSATPDPELSRWVIELPAAFTERFGITPPPRNPLRGTIPAHN